MDEKQVCIKLISITWSQFLLECLIICKAKKKLTDFLFPFHEACILLWYIDYLIQLKAPKVYKVLCMISTMKCATRVMYNFKSKLQYVP